MANVNHYFAAESALLSSSSIPELTTIQPTTPSTQATNTVYAAVVGEFLQFRFRAINYASGNLTVDVDWFVRANPGATSEVAFSAAIAAVTPNVDTGSVTAKAYATATNGNTTGISTSSAGRMFRTTITVSNLDSLAQDDFVYLKVSRISPTGGGTDMSTDACIDLITVSYLSV